LRHQPAVLRVELTGEFGNVGDGLPKGLAKMWPVPKFPTSELIGNLAWHWHFADL
jgi:hypothetical protein